jgi:hypothetical protein
VLSGGRREELACGLNVTKKHTHTHIERERVFKNKIILSYFILKLQQILNSKEIKLSKLNTFKYWDLENKQLFLDLF